MVERPVRDKKVTRLAGKVPEHEEVDCHVGDLEDGDKRATLMSEGTVLEGRKL